MKFLDFLQDVTAVGAVLAVSAFLVDGPSSTSASSTQPSSAATNSMSGSGPLMLPELSATGRADRESLEPLPAGPADLVPLEADPFASSQSGEKADDQGALFAGVRARSQEPITPSVAPHGTPAPLDLDMLDAALNEQLGLSNTGLASREPAPRGRPNDQRLSDELDTLVVNQSERLRSEAPAPSSRPLGGVTRGYDESDPFEAATDASTPPSSLTRRLGPVDFLSPPAEF